MCYHIHQLDNGIRLIHQETKSPVSHCGLIVQTGSRNEKMHEHGLAHLIEHMLFKGTEKRKAYHILSRMEDVGGELNAYTTKEETCVYTTFYNNYYDRALELISDVVFHSVYPAKELKKEKEVIVDEINSYKDSPFEQIFDDFDELVFEDKILGRSILGTEESLSSFERNNIIDFINENYCTDQMVVSSVGDIAFSKVKHLFEKYFADIKSKLLGGGKNSGIGLKIAQAGYKEVKVDTYQAHCILGTLGYSHQDDKRIVLHLINNILGGPGLNSRLNLSLREKRGYAYNIESNYTTYNDTGVIAIYFGTDKKDLKKCIQLAKKEIDKLCTVRLGVSQLARAKKQLLGQIAISSENFEGQMLANGKSVLVYDKIDPLDKIKDRIEKISSADIMDVANEVLAPDRISTLIYY